MANFTSSSSSDFSAIISVASTTAAAVVDDAFEDACSICLDPFTSQDPSIITCCKHEYHLQCILDWSQRSKECPICWQPLVLKDPACQELLTAVETEMHLRSRTTSSATSANQLYSYEDSDVEQDSYSDDSDFDENIMQHLAAASRARYVNGRERQRSSGHGPSQFLMFNSPVSIRGTQQTNTSIEEGQDVSNGSSGSNSATSLMAPQPLPTVVPPVVNVISSTTVDADIPSKPRVFIRQPPDDVPRAPSEVLSFSESIKSKWFATSARYKESISKSTRGIKEKLLARNNSVKEISKGVQRDMSAGIAGVARLIERLDLTPKRAGVSIPVSGFGAGASDPSMKGKGMQENIIAQALQKKSEELAHAASMDVSSHVSCPVPVRLEVPHMQRGH